MTPTCISLFVSSSTEDEIQVMFHITDQQTTLIKHEKGPTVHIPSEHCVIIHCCLLEKFTQ